jgi:hypothetical protein
MYCTCAMWTTYYSDAAMFAKLYWHAILYQTRVPATINLMAVFWSSQLKVKS